MSSLVTREEANGEESFEGFLSGGMDLGLNSEPDQERADKGVRLMGTEVSFGLSDCAESLRGGRKSYWTGGRTADG